MLNFFLKYWPQDLCTGVIALNRFFIDCPTANYVATIMLLTFLETMFQEQRGK